MLCMAVCLTLVVATIFLSLQMFPYTSVWYKDTHVWSQALKAHTYTFLARTPLPSQVIARCWEVQLQLIDCCLFIRFRCDAQTPQGCRQEYKAQEALSGNLQDIHLQVGLL